MPDDEPLDDARVVGMAAAAAAAKVVETAARAAVDRRNRPQHDPAATERRLHELAAAERWAASHSPDRLQHYYAERDAALSGPRADTTRLRGAEASLVEDWRNTQPEEASTLGAAEQPTSGYDNAARRTGVDSAMKAAGVAEEPRRARAVSDLLNGADPSTAAASGKAAKATAATAKQRTPEQARTR